MTGMPGSGRGEPDVRSEAGNEFISAGIESQRERGFAGE
jgi:hypothetical protein